MWPVRCSLETGDHAELYQWCDWSFDVATITFRPNHVSVTSDIKYLSASIREIIGLIIPDASPGTEFCEIARNRENTRAERFALWLSVGTFAKVGKVGSKDFNAFATVGLGHSRGSGAPASPESDPPESIN